MEGGCNAFRRLVTELCKTFKQLCEKIKKSQVKQRIIFAFKKREKSNGNASISLSSGHMLILNKTECTINTV